MKGFFQLISTMEFLDLFQPFHALESESVPLDASAGRVLAGEVLAGEALPPFTRSTMDGYAVRARDTFGCSESEAALLQVVGEVRMGQSGRSYFLRPGQATRIWTGGELPDKADAVVMVEYSSPLDQESVELYRPVAPGENTIQAGDDYPQGAAVLDRGQLLRPQELGVLAGLGYSRVEVHRRPRVAIISTGDELVAPEQHPGPGQIRDINSTTLASLVRQAGAIPLNYGIIADDAAALEEACKRGLAEADVLLLSGGSSVGQRDYTLQVFEQLPGTALLAHGVSIRPGKPTILARSGNQALFGLPGNVASAMVVFYLFVRPLLRKLGGLGCSGGLQTIRVETGQQIPSTIGREDYVRVRLVAGKGSGLPLAEPLYGKSGLLKPLVQAQGLLVIGRDVEGLDQGAEATVLLFP
ncbi:molybdopterin molybdotransferase MoeA [Desulfogranum mediterraneum]|uniref:molybdopterin molybdotransferase MoeA n=1 Tax=Desulfogranum mediterraneum TaxID=160661 RepID=UPI0003F8D9A6|nr:gephyrin-like molybdotransferase Glp [Desulfogranum mediterraneum]